MFFFFSIPKFAKDWMSKTGLQLVFGFEKLGPSPWHSNSTSKMGFSPAKTRIETAFFYQQKLVGGLEHFLFLHILGC